MILYKIILYKISTLNQGDDLSLPLPLQKEGRFNLYKGLEAIHSTFARDKD